MLSRWAILGLGVAFVFVLYVGWRTWYLSKPGLRSMLFFRPCKLLSKETLVEAAPDRLAVRRFVFALPGGDTGEPDVQLALGEHIKVRGAGFLPFARSYSPVAVRRGEIELVVKIYPADGRGKTPAGVSSHLDSLQEGEEALLSGPYPPPFQRVAREPGRKVGIVAYGVGITEALGVAWGELPRADEVALLWALRDRSELYAQQELQALRDAGLQVRYHFSREGGGGRLGPQQLREAFPWGPVDSSGKDSEHAQEVRFLVVGTKAMKRETYAMLASAGLPCQRLLKKTFGMRKKTLGMRSVRDSYRQAPACPSEALGGGATPRAKAPEGASDSVCSA